MKETPDVAGPPHGVVGSRAAGAALAPRRSGSAPREWLLELPFTAPLSMNDRGHWRARARKVAAWRQAGLVCARAAKVPALERFTVVLHYAPRDMRRRDPENLIASLKPIVDGIVEAGVAPDDCPPYYSTSIPVIEAPTHARTGRLWARVVDLGGDP